MSARFVVEHQREPDVVAGVEDAAGVATLHKLLAMELARRLGAQIDGGLAVLAADHDDPVQRHQNWIGESLVGDPELVERPPLRVVEQAVARPQTARVPRGQHADEAAAGNNGRTSSSHSCRTSADQSQTVTTPRRLGGEPFLALPCRT